MGLTKSCAIQEKTSHKQHQTRSCDEEVNLCQATVLSKVNHFFTEAKKKLIVLAQNCVINEDE